jgi:outer membrane protein assembly factor BamA
MRINAFGTAVAVVCLAVGVLRAQDAPSRVGPNTQVRSIAFEFEGDHVLREADLTPHLALTGQGALVGLRKLLGILPLIPPVGPHPFTPVELERDVVRLRNFYRRSGFLHAIARYEVRYDAKADVVRIVYRIREGPQLRVRSLAFRDGADSGRVRDSAVAVPPELRTAWDRYTRRTTRRVRYIGEVDQRRLADSTRRWFRDRGYPFAAIDIAAAVDTTASEADVMVLVRAGDRARIAAFQVQGNKTVPAKDLTRQLPIGRGDWYSARGLEQGRLQLTQLDIVRLAIFDTPESPVTDSGVVVKLRVTENLPHLIDGDAGFASNGGLTAQTEWTHRSFLGGVRTLTIAGLAQSGVLALEQPPQRLFRLGARIFQPYVGSRRLSAGGGPFVEYRDDYRDRSWAFGLEGSLVYATSPLRSLALGYSLARRRIMEYGFGADLGPIAYLPLLGLSRPGAVDTLGKSVRQSTVTLQGSYGWFDEFTYPRKGYVVRPRIVATVPGGAFNTSEYLSLDLGASGFISLARHTGFALRASAGRIFPYGKSVAATSNQSPIVSLLRLSDAVFTAGGTRDVRGWGTQLVGPKVPDVQTKTTDGVTTTFADRYAPIGGLARVTGSVELRMPLPGFSDAWQSSVFADGGRIWNPDRRFAIGSDVLEQSDFYTAVGVGVSYVTVVGAVQFSVGYKLNPSPLDIRSASDVFGALSTGQPLDAVPTDSRQRLHLHFALGTTF